MNDRFMFRFWNKSRKIMETFNNSPLTLGGLLLGKNDNYEILSCTGLKDKDGKLIYEGDVIKCPSFSTDTYIIDYSWGEYFCNINGHYGAGYSIQVLTEHNEDIEVIGNIYKNPELLKECE